ncbi:MAG: TonB-dependent receptor, partial [Prevotella sp.]|nr:TonB-dependent receptor [Prevotella sp.]
MDDNYVPGMFHTPQFNIGLYHESNVDLTDRLMLTLGLRYDYQRVSIDYDTRSTFRLDYNGTMQGRPMSTSHTFTSYMQSNHHTDYSQLLPKLALTYRLDNKGNNVYMAVSKGFRAGGYNLQMFSDIFRTEQSQLGAQLMQLMQKDVVVEHTDAEYDNVNNTIAYKPEESWNYELGSRLNLFGGKVHADISAYYMQIRNQQLSVMAGRYGYGRMMVNAGKSSSAGVEVALRGSAFNDRLSWSATYGYAYSTFRQYTDSLADGTTDNHRGNYVPFVPKHTFSAAADYSIPVSETALLRSLTIGANVNGNGRIYWDAANKHSQPLYATLGAHVLLDFNLLKLNLWARNITDTRYNTFLVESSADGVARTFSQRNNPFQCGVDLSLSF